MMFAIMGFSQFEVKVNPIGLLWGNMDLSGEYILNDNMGAEAEFAYYFKQDDLFGTTVTNSKSSRFVGILSYKYYFKPEDGGDKFYAFPYFRYKSSKFSITDNAVDYDISYTALGVGFGLGYKWVATSGLLFDLGVGAGKNFGGGWNWVATSGLLFDLGVGAGKNFGGGWNWDGYSTGIDIPVWPVNFISRLSIGYRF